MLRMRIVPLAAVPHRVIDHFDSVGFMIGRLVHGEASAHIARLEGNGRIGPHLAVQRQLLIPIDGSVEVSGSPVRWTPLRPGQAALWEPDEEHETRSADGAVLLIVETDADLLPGADGIMINPDGE